MSTAEYQRQLRLRNLERHRKRDRERYSRNKFRRYLNQVRLKYNLSTKEYERLKQDQNNCCAICKEEKRLVVDHCHKTGEVRGLLCHYCNNGMGYLDNSDFMNSANEYWKVTH